MFCEVTSVEVWTYREVDETRAGEGMIFIEQRV